jgi:hypothetical protein
MRNWDKVLVLKPDGKKLLGRPRHRCEVDIKMDLKEIKYGILTGFIWLRIGTVVGFCEHGNEPLVYIKGGVFLD